MVTRPAGPVSDSADRAGRDRQPFNYNQWGGTVGGPIRKERTFFFFNYEQFKQRTVATTIRSVPTSLQKGGDFSQTLIDHHTVPFGLFFFLVGLFVRPGL